ncbi:MAG: Lrp/AsnC family transcriptional regulator, partial [Sedimenticola sp.]|nr:Lrp/AsnC family transcriptional regulator [Sedimenticola sp.]
MAPHTLDRIDERILNQLQKDNQISNLKLAEQVGLSPPACLRRVKRLRDEQVITGDVSLVDPQIAGHNINIIVEVEMERDHLELSAQFRKSIMASPEVTQCYAVTGEVDFILVV